MLTSNAAASGILTQEVVIEAPHDSSAGGRASQSVSGEDFLQALAA